jgi:hypothetical protein
MWEECGVDSWVYFFGMDVAEEILAMEVASSGSGGGFADGKALD